MILKGRKNIVPDTGRITGAVTRERTLEFLEWLDKQEKLSKEEKTLFKDVAVVLYAGGLRVFQLLEVCKGSFVNDKNEKDLWIGVPKKGNQTAFEQKIVDRDGARDDKNNNFTTRLREIIERRGGEKRDPLFPKKEFTQGKRDKFADLCKQASVELNWPAGHHFHGTHMFRHGAISDAFAEGGILLAKLRGGHESDKCMKVYARSDAERNQLCLMQQEENKKKLEQATTKVLREAEDRALELAAERDIDAQEFKPNLEMANRQDEAEKKMREKYMSSLDISTQLNEKMRGKGAGSYGSFCQDWNKVESRKTISITVLKTSSNSNNNNDSVDGGGNSSFSVEDLARLINDQLKEVIKETIGVKENLVSTIKSSTTNEQVVVREEFRNKNKSSNNSTNSSMSAAKKVKLNRWEVQELNEGVSLAAVMRKRGLIWKNGSWEQTSFEDRSRLREERTNNSLEAVRKMLQ